jgi:hypothetical protein
MSPIHKRFEGITFPIPTFPLVFKEVVKMFPFTNKTFDPVSRTHKFAPTVSVFEVPKAFPMATFPVVTREFEEFVRSRVFDVVFPKFTTWSRVKLKRESVIDVILPEVSTDIVGMRDVEPYAPDDVPPTTDFIYKAFP